MANITLGMFRDYLKAVSDWVTGATASAPKVKPLGRVSHVSVEGTANILAGSVAFDVEHIVFIANDSDDNITFNFDALPTAAGHFTLRPGEVFGDVPKAVTALHYAAAADGKSFRAVGVK